MAASQLEVAVFIDTDFGTRLAVAVSPHIAAGALKSEAKLKLLPFVLTKLTSRVEAVQFLHVKARPLNEFIEPRLPENADCFPNLNNVTYPLERRGYSRQACKSKIRIDDKKHTRKRFRTKKYLSRLVCRSILAWNTRRKRKRTNKNQLLEHVEKNSNMEDPIKEAENLDGSIDTLSYHSVPNDEAMTTKQRYASSSLVSATASELSSEVMSVSSIIKRYFSSHDEVSSVPNRLSRGVTQSWPEEYLKKKKNMQRDPSLLPLKLPFKAGSQKPERSKLGKRLVMASYNLGISLNRERPEISLCTSRGEKFQELMSLAKSSCFEISDSED